MYHNRFVHGHGCPRAAMACYAGFTMVELITVIVISSIIAITAIPAISAISRANLKAASKDIASQIELAHEYAIATNTWAGLDLQTSTGKLSLRIADQNGSNTVSMPDPLGVARPDVFVPGRYPGITISALQNGKPGSTWTAIWFSYKGVPFAGTYTGPDVSSGEFANDAVVSVSSTSQQASITISRETGAVLR